MCATPRFVIMGGMEPDRATLMLRHEAARRRRDVAPLDSAEYRTACEEIARIETAIAAAEEPPVALPDATTSGR